VVETFRHILYDNAVLESSMRHKTAFELPKDSPACSEVAKIIEKFNLLHGKS